MIMEWVIIFLFIILILLILVLRYNLLDKMGRLEEEIVRLREELRGREGEDAPKLQVAKAEATDWEKFIGENLISKIGIAILVLAIGFFVKYAIDNDWIGPVGRVGIGLLCGAILIGLAHRLPSQYKAFSSVLIGGGLAVLYFTIALAYHQYHLFGQTTAFILMLVITAFSVVLSILNNREELAIIALLGGFVTPYLVRNGIGDYELLFTYLLILNTGLLVIAYYKAWRLLNGLAFGFTVVLFASWLAGLPDNAGRSVYYGGAAFATAFYGLFFIVNVAHTIRKKKKFIASDFLILLLNTCLYSGVSVYFFSRLGLEGYRGLYCATMGVIHLVLSWLLFRRQSAKPAMAAVFAWAAAIFFVIFLSAEGQMLINILFYSRQHSLDELQGVYDKTGLPILWGLCSFVCMWLGMRHRFRPLRIFSLVLFMVTLLKLFLFDIRDIPIAGKIAAFFCLGVLLLVVSFMYQRLKKIIIDNEAKISE